VPAGIRLLLDQPEPAGAFPLLAFFLFPDDQRLGLDQPFAGIGQQEAGPLPHQVGRRLAGQRQRQADPQEAAGDAGHGVGGEGSPGAAA
jgi:hypothetical protein